jgi:hypothetical protein
VLPDANYQNGYVEYVSVAGSESASSVIYGIYWQSGDYVKVANVI